MTEIEKPLKLISKKDAMAAGLNRYFTGIPCRHGHISERRVADNDECIACAKKGRDRDYRVNREYILEKCKLWRDNNKDKIRERDARYQANYSPEKKAAEIKRLTEWVANNPEKVRSAREKNKDLSRFWHAKYRVENREIIRARKQKYAAENAEKIALKRSQWKKENPDKVAVQGSRRRAQKVNAGGDHTAADLNKIFKMQHGKCAYCRTKLKMGHGGNAVRDHIVALARCGSNARSNIQILCQPCNNKKHAKDPIDFARSLGMLV